MTGKQDWQSADQQHNQVLYSQQAVSLGTGSTTLFSGASSSWSSLQMRVMPATGQGQFTVAWYADSGLTQIVGSDTWRVNSNTALFALYPVQAQFCKITFNNTGTSSLTAKIYIIATQLTAIRTAYLAGAIFTEATNQSVPAGGSVTLIPNFLTRGPAHLYFFTGAAAGSVNCKVSITTESGSIVADIINLNSPTGPNTAEFQVPDQPLLITLINDNTTPAHTASVCLVVPGID